MSSPDKPGVKFSDADDIDVPKQHRPISMPRTSRLPSFHESDFWVDLDHVHLGPQIGRGQFSTVYVGKYFGDTVAVKKQTREALTLETYLMRELSVLKSCQHENLVSYFGAYNEVQIGKEGTYALYIVTEFCQNGDLLRILLDPDPLGWKFRIRIALEAATALQHLHDLNYVHRDIKSSNFLLDHNWTLKISDFGMTREAVDDIRMTICGTDEYMAPELMFDEVYSMGVDVYSFGMVLLEIMKRVKVGSDGFAKRMPQNNFELDLDAVQAQIPPDTPPSLVLLARECINYEVGARPTAREIKEWLQDLYETTEDDTIPAPKLRPIPANFGKEDADASGSKIGNAGDVGGGTTAPNASAAMNSSFGSENDDKTALSPEQLKARADGFRGRGVVITDSTKALLHAGVGPNDLKSNITPQEEKALWKSNGLSSESWYSDREAVKAGYLHKRTSRGFRNWKKIWFTISSGRLWWRNSDRSTVKFIELRGASLQKCQHFRFKIHYNSSCETEGIAATPLERELSADSAIERETWMAALQQVIDESNMASTFVPPASSLESGESSREQCRTSSLNFVTIDDWLSALELPQYASIFREKGYTMNMLHLQGISEEELEKSLDIKIAAHRHLLLRSISIGSFSHNLKVTIQGWRDFGSVTVYKVISRWKLSRSVIYLRFTDFKKFDSFLRKELKDDRALIHLLSRFPPLPGQGLMQDSKDVAFINARMSTLETYLLQVASLVGDSPQLQYFTLRFLELIPTEGNDGAKIADDIGLRMRSSSA